VNDAQKEALEVAARQIVAAAEALVFHRGSWTWGQRLEYGLDDTFESPILLCDWCERVADNINEVRAAAGEFLPSAAPYNLYAIDLLRSGCPHPVTAPPVEHGRPL
jgi:hypothetical protein